MNPLLALLGNRLRRVDVCRVRMAGGVQLILPRPIGKGSQMESNMKARSIRMIVLPAILALSVAVSSPSWAGNSTLPMKNGPVITAKEARALIGTATKAKDHLKLARYFNQEADQFEAEARDHDEMIEAYRKSTNSATGKTPGGVGTIEHCEFLAKSSREMAKALREMAAAHEEMAKQPAK
jgi:hypothetical protein